MNNLTLTKLMQVAPHTGEQVWIDLRPARGEAMITVYEVMANQHSGLIGDRYIGASCKRQVTLIQWEHLPVLESIMGKTIAPELLRRNLVIRRFPAKNIPNLLVFLSISYVVKRVA